MSEVLDLTELLRSLDDSRLKELLRELMLSETRYKDFFDLAEAMLQPKNFDNWMSTLSREELEQIVGVGSAQKHRDRLIEFLHHSESIKSKLNQLGRVFDESQEILRAENEEPSDSRELGVQIFETCLAITEICHEQQHRRVASIGKGNLASGELKRLAAMLGQETDFVRDIFTLARSVGLLKVESGAFTLTANGHYWLSASTKRRWQILVGYWLALLGRKAQTIIAKNGQLILRAPLSDFLHSTFPLAKDAADSRFDRLSRYARWLGLAQHGRATQLLVAAVQIDSDTMNQLPGGVTEILDEVLPKPQSRIIVQGDLSIIAPGPLDTQSEKLIRNFVEVEQAGLASRYRLTPSSVSEAMEAGWQASKILGALEELSGTIVPQPVSYLIHDVEKRFGQIVVSRDAQTGATLIGFTDPVAMVRVQHQIDLKPFAFTTLNENTLWSPYEVDVVYFGLRDVGILATRKIANTEIVDALIPPQVEQIATDPVDELVNVLRTADDRLLSQSDDDSLMRQIQLAIKNKYAITVEYLGKDGVSHTFNLEPTSVANGRLRGTDRKADIERTLTIANIRAVHAAPNTNSKK